MNTISGKIIGNINVEVYQTSEGKNFFYLQANNKNVVHVLDFLDAKLTEFNPKLDNFWYNIYGD